MEWVATNYGFEERLHKVLLTWENTPYKLGDQRKGLGTDCIRFCCGTIDEMFGFARAAIELLPQDLSMNQPATAFKTMRKLKKLYAPLEYVPISSPVEPGDLVVSGPIGGGPGHLMIVGAQPNTLWHATNTKVVQTGMAVPVEQTHFKTLRFKDKALWPNK